MAGRKVETIFSLLKWVYSFLATFYYGPSSPSCPRSSGYEAELRYQYSFGKKLSHYYHDYREKFICNSRTGPDFLFLTTVCNK